jgi:hypothetical protein
MRINSPQPKRCARGVAVPWHLAIAAHSSARGFVQKEYGKREGWFVVAAEMEKFARSFLMPLAKWHQVSVFPNLASFIASPTGAHQLPLPIPIVFAHFF